MPFVRLEPLAGTHTPHVARLVTDPDVLQFTRVPDPPPADFPSRWVATYEDGRRDGSREGFAVFDGAGRFVGLALAPDVDRAAREAELGYIVTPEARGRGFASEMLKRITRWAFDEAQIIRAFLIINVDNHASLRVADRCGYVREGVLRSIHLKDGLRVDAALYSRLRTDAEPAVGGG